METVETKNSKLWLILAIVFGVLIVLPATTPLVLFFFMYVPVIFQLYSWIILPKIKRWLFFTYAVPWLNAVVILIHLIIRVSLQIERQDLFFVMVYFVAFVVCFLWGLFWIFFPCIRLIRRTILRIFCYVTFSVILFTFIVPLALILLDIRHWDFASCEWSWNLDPRNWNWWFIDLNWDLVF